MCHFQLRKSELTAGAEEPIVRRVARAWPGSIAVFSIFGGAEWDFCHAADGRTRRLSVDQNLFAADELARMLLSLRAFDLRDEKDLSGLEVAANARRMFARTRARRRARRLVLESPLYKEVNRWKLLTAREEQELARQIARGDAAARERLFCSNLRLVLSVAKRFWKRRLDFDDVVQEGCRGLMVAVERFDPARGYKFSTYATWWIMQSVQRGQQTQSHTVALPVHLLQPVARARNVWRNWMVTRGRRPGEQELCDELGMSWTELAPVRHALRAFWRPRPLPPDLVDPAVGLAHSAAAHRSQMQLVQRCLERLSERQADILRMRWGLDGGPEMTLEEIGAVFRLTRERIRQIEKKAWEELLRTVRLAEAEPARRRRHARGRAGALPRPHGRHG